jgi:hypothetical protein
MPPHPPNGIGDGGQLDAREDLSPRSATHTTSSPVPEGKPLLRSTWPDVAPRTSTRPLRPLQVLASCRRGYSSELTLRTIEMSITHVEEMGTSVVGKLSQELTTREARIGAVIWRRHDELETTAGHIWSEREPVRRKPASTCSFAAPGVALEPTTYGLTVRGSQVCPRSPKGAGRPAYRRPQPRVGAVDIQRDVRRLGGRSFQDSAVRALRTTSTGTTPMS